MNASVTLIALTRLSEKRYVCIQDIPLFRIAKLFRYVQTFVRNFLVITLK